MDFSLSAEETILKDVARRFTTKELSPLDKVLLDRELRMWTDGISLLSEEDQARLLRTSKDLGFWGIEVAEEC